MDTTQELRTTNLTTKRNCLSRIARSPIPAPVAKTLTLILEHFGSATHYSLAWISHRKLAELQGRSERSVERHCKAIVESRLLTVEPMGCGQARAMLMTRYGHTMKGVYAHFLCFYSINSEHPFWQGDEAATAEVVATMRTAVSWPSRTASNGAEPRHLCRGSGAVNPDTSVAVNPDTSVAVNPDTSVGRARLEKTVAVAPVFSQSTSNDGSTRPTPSPAGEELLLSRGSEPQIPHSLEILADEAPRPATTWERIELASPCKSTDSPAELAELWRDRRGQILAMYRQAGLEPTPELLVGDITHLLVTTFQARLSLGAVLGPRWGRMEKAIAARIASTDARISEHLLYLVAELGDLRQHSDAVIVATWERLTGGGTCPPVAAIRKLTTTTTEKN